MISFQAVHTKLSNHRKQNRSINGFVKLAIIKVIGVSFVQREYGYNSRNKINQEIVCELKRNPHVKSYSRLKKNAYIVLLMNNMESHAIELVSRLSQSIYNRIGNEFDNIIWINTCLMEKPANAVKYNQAKELIPQNLLDEIFCVLETGYKKVYQLDKADYPYKFMQFEEMI